MRLAWGFLLFCLLLARAEPCQGAKNGKVVHFPERPGSGEVVKVTATGALFQNQSGYVLQYQVVEPGAYIERKDPGYTNGWISVAMQKSSGGQGSYSAELPASL